MRSKSRFLEKSQSSRAELGFHSICTRHVRFQEWIHFRRVSLRINLGEDFEQDLTPLVATIQKSEATLLILSIQFEYAWGKLFVPLGGPCLNLLPNLMELRLNMMRTKRGFSGCRPLRKSKVESNDDHQERSFLKVLGLPSVVNLSDNHSSGLFGNPSSLSLSLGGEDIQMEMMLRGVATTLKHLNLPINSRFQPTEFHFPGLKVLELIDLGNNFYPG